MKLLKPVAKKTSKNERERKVLLSLIEHYIRLGKPVGSNTLKEVGFADLSSATIRNYFAHLEEGGYLIQQHTSGGRIPTDKAFRLYAEEYRKASDHAGHHEFSPFEQLRSGETNEITAFLHHAAEKLSEKMHMAVFLSAPRFEQDFITGIKLISIDSERCVTILITDFGKVITEILHVDRKLSAFAIKRLEHYFNWRLTSQNKPENLTQSEEDLGIKLYNEMMVRFIVSYSHSNAEEIYRTGFSSLLFHPEFHDGTILANSLSLFENTQGMRLILREICKLNTLKFWIGDDLAPYTPQSQPNCAVIALPYFVNNHPVGGLGLLGPTRMPYRTAFATLHQFAESISQTLTNSLYKFKISMRVPTQQTVDFDQHLQLNSQTPHLMLEDNRPPALVDKRPNPAIRRK